MVFDRLNDDGLGYAGTLREAFDPARLRWCASGRLYHELTHGVTLRQARARGLARGARPRQDERARRRARDDVRLDWRGASYPVAPVAFPTAEPPFVVSVMFVSRTDSQSAFGLGQHSLRLGRPGGRGRRFRPHHAPPPRPDRPISPHGLDERRGRAAPARAPARGQPHQVVGGAPALRGAAAALGPGRPDL